MSVLFACMYVCMCSACVPGTYGYQKRALNSLELLWTVVDCHVGAGH